MMRQNSEICLDAELIFKISPQRRKSKQVRKGERYEFGSTERLRKMLTRSRKEFSMWMGIHEISPSQFLYNGTDNYKRI